ncbi:hypothetical protein RMATCC62417_18620 [Rhizopus microsporus]|nr:hypothetical protein RMATCC62417_18620 [Rhizopus microsporus]
MISFTTGINTVLGNIQELDLRGNRLTLLAGLDRLWALERLDVRDNRIDDAAEIGRLTSLPNIYDIWVEGNPFTKPDYRVNIFSMFKKCDLDIELDGSKPTFVEKRRITSEPMIHNSTPPAAVQSCPDHSKENNDHNTKLARAKSKGNKRMIRLGQNAIDPPAFASNVEPSKHVHRLAELEDSVQQEVASTATKARRAASVKSKRSKAPIEDGSKPKTDAFRKKIEAMRKEAGTEWLRVLQEMDIVKEENKSQ